MRVLKMAAIGLILGGLNACAWVPSMDLFQPSYTFKESRLKVQELRRALLCGTPTEASVVRLFDTAADLVAWDAKDKLQLSRLELPADRSFVLLEQGLRRTGGYSVEIDKQAQLNTQGVLQFKADWLEPAPDRVVTQMVTSLCVLVAVDAMPYNRVEVLDREGKLRASVDLYRE